MSLQDIRSECSDTAALLQPYVDGELRGDDERRVAEHLETCVPCGSAVQEQMWVRVTLRTLEKPTAPQALRARLLQELDAVDREQASAAPDVPQRSRFWTKARALLRGGLVMLPAGAVATALFFTLRSGVGPVAGDVQTAGLGASLASAGEQRTTQPLADLEPQVGLPVQVANTRTSPEIELVSAQLDEPHAAARQAAASFRYRVRREGEASPQHVLDRQAPASISTFEGRPVTFRGQRYILHRGEGGRPVVQFERGGIAHTLVLEHADTAVGSAVEMAQPDFSLLLHFADRHLARNEE